MVLRLVDRIGKLGDSYQKTAIAQQIFGRGGAELIPVFNRLAKDGVEETRRRLEEMGLLMTKDFAEAAEAAAQGMKKLEGQARGAATQFVAGFVPGITQAIDAMNEAVSGKGVNGFQDPGRGGGVGVKSDYRPGRHGRQGGRGDDRDLGSASFYVDRYGEGGGCRGLGRVGDGRGQRRDRGFLERRGRGL